MYLIVKQKYQSGFTIIELVVSVLIIATISGIFLANYHRTNEKQKLVMATQMVASNIRLAQSYSLGAKKFKGSVPNGGWGIGFRTLYPEYYVIFADVDASRKIEVDEDYKIIELPEGITIDYLETGEGSTDRVGIVFDPPDPIVYITADDNNHDWVFIQLKGAGGGEKGVNVNSLGLVDVDL